MGADGVTRIYAFKVLGCLASGDVYARIGIPKQTAFAEPDRALRRKLLALGCVSLFALLAAWLGGNLAVVREVQHFVRTTQRLAAVISALALGFRSTAASSVSWRALSTRWPGPSRSARPSGGRRKKRCGSTASGLRPWCALQDDSTSNWT